MPKAWPGKIDRGRAPGSECHQTDRPTDLDRWRPFETSGGRGVREPPSTRCAHQTQVNRDKSAGFTAFMLPYCCTIIFLLLPVLLIRGREVRQGEGGGTKNACVGCSITPSPTLISSHLTQPSPCPAPAFGEQEATTVEIAGDESTSTVDYCVE